MTPDNLWYWMQGYYELTGTYKLTDEQQKMLHEHHQLCAQKVTPNNNMLHSFLPTKIMRIDNIPYYTIEPNGAPNWYCGDIKVNT